MNSVHDLGGMHGFGPVKPEPESEEPVFHSAWEARVYGINRAVGFLGGWNIDMNRHSRERLDPVTYLKNSYYENWLAGLEILLVESGLVSREELETGLAGSRIDPALEARVLKAEMVGKVPIRVTNYRREVDTAPRYRMGDRVKAINRHPHGHTREPRYVRGRVGTIHEYYGGQVFPDLSAQGIDEGRHLYSVRFEADELWGSDADPGSAVYVDLFEDYLEPAE